MMCRRTNCEVASCGQQARRNFDGHRSVISHEHLTVETASTCSQPSRETVTELIDTIVATTPDVRRAVADYRGQSNSVNPTGDDQLAADLRADELFEQRVLGIDGVASYASEERADVKTSRRSPAVRGPPR